MLRYNLLSLMAQSPRSFSLKKPYLIKSLNFQQLKESSFRIFLTVLWFSLRFNYTTLSETRGPMKLKDFLFLMKYTHKAFSKKIGISQQQISNIIAGRRRPSIQLAKKIEIETNGRVTMQELVDD